MIIANLNANMVKLSLYIIISISYGCQGNIKENKRGTSHSAFNGDSGDAIPQEEVHSPIEENPLDPEGDQVVDEIGGEDEVADPLGSEVTGETLTLEKEFISSGTENVQLTQDLEKATTSYEEVVMMKSVYEEVNQSFQQVTREKKTHTWIQTSTQKSQFWLPNGDCMDDSETVKVNGTWINPGDYHIVKNNGNTFCYVDFDAPPPLNASVFIEYKSMQDLTQEFKLDVPIAAGFEKIALVQGGTHTTLMNSDGYDITIENVIKFEQPLWDGATFEITYAKANTVMNQLIYPLKNLPEGAVATNLTAKIKQGGDVLKDAELVEGTKIKFAEKDFVEKQGIEVSYDVVGKNRVDLQEGIIADSVAVSFLDAEGMVVDCGENAYFINKTNKLVLACSNTDAVKAEVNYQVAIEKVLAYNFEGLPEGAIEVNWQVLVNGEEFTDYMMFKTTFQFMDSLPDNATVKIIATYVNPMM